MNFKSHLNKQEDLWWSKHQFPFNSINKNSVHQIEIINPIKLILIVIIIIINHNNNDITISRSFITVTMNYKPTNRHIFNTVHNAKSSDQNSQKGLITWRRSREELSNINQCPGSINPPNESTIPMPSTCTCCVQLRCAHHVNIPTWPCAWTGAGSPYHRKDRLVHNYLRPSNSQSFAIICDRSWLCSTFGCGKFSQCWQCEANLPNHRVWPWTPRETVTGIIEEIQINGC